jgi:hypothetical protein
LRVGSTCYSHQNQFVIPAQAGIQIIKSYCIANNIVFVRYAGWLFLLDSGLTGGQPVLSEVEGPE